MKWLIKPIGRSLAFIITPLLVAILALLLVIGTHPGSRWLVEQGLASLDDRVRVGEVQGTLLGPLVFDALTYDGGDGTHLAITRLELDWRPLNLLLGELSITRLQVQGVYLSLPEAEAKPPGLALPVLRSPLRIRLSNTNINDILIRTEKDMQIDEVQLSARWRDVRLAIQSLTVRAPQGEVRTEGELRLDEDYPLDLRWQWHSTTLAEQLWMGEGSFEGSLRKLRLQQTLNAPYMLKIDGQLALPADAEANFDVHANWEDIQWPPLGEATANSRAGHARVYGSAAAYQLQMEHQLTSPSAPPMRMRLQGRGDAAQLTLSESVIETLGGSVQVDGELHWQPSLSWDARIDARGLQPQQHWPGQEAEINARVHVSGARDAQGVQARLDIESSGGQWRGKPLQAQGSVRLQGDAVFFDDLQINSGSAQLAVNGRLEEHWQLDWQLAIPDLSQLDARGMGRFTGEGNLRGARAQPLINASIKGGQLGFAAARIHELAGELRLDLADKSESQFSFKLADARLAGVAYDGLAIEASGRKAAHRLAVTITGEQRNADLFLTGRWQDQGWQGEWTRADMRDEGLGNWSLQQPSALRFEQVESRWQITQACWAQDDARLCAQAQGQAADWQADAQLHEFAWQKLAAWLPPEMEISGDVSAELTAKSTAAGPDLRLAIRPSAGTLQYRQSKDEVIKIPFEQGHIEASLSEGVLNADAQLILAGQGELRADLRAAPLHGPGGAGEAKLSGQITGGLQSIGLVGAFLPFADETTGQLDIDLALSGSLAQPRVTGQAALSGVNARLPDLGLHVQDLQLRVSGDGSEQLAIQGQVRSGPGTLNVVGSLGLDAEQHWPLQLTLQGDRVLLSDLPEARVLATPNLTLALAGRDVQVHGEVLIPEADIRLKELPQGAVQVSPDVVVLQSDLQAPASAMRINTDVAIKLGDKVRFSGFNLATRVTGDLRVTEKPGRPTQARGVLTLKDGKYAAYGKKLDISRGRLVFAGPLDNPQLDVRTERKVDEVTAGIQVRGPLRDVEVSLFSSPSMEQGDVLSYLLVGRPMNQASKAEGQVLADAATSLGLGGGEFLAKQIGGAFGLDDVRVDTGSSAEDAALVIGTYLSPRLYVSYGIGLFTPENLIRLRYALTRKLTLQAESGTQSGVDLLYVLEYD